MNELEWLQRMRRVTAADAPPQMDVTRGVLERIRLLERDRMRVFGAAAAAGSVAAAIAITFAALAWSEWQDPLNRFVDPVALVLQ